MKRIPAPTPFREPNPRRRPLGDESNDSIGEMIQSAVCRGIRHAAQGAGAAPGGSPIRRTATTFASRRPSSATAP